MRGLLLLLICCLFSSFAVAQQTTRDPLQAKELTPEERIEEMLGEKKDDLQTLQDYTDAFYNNCVNTQHAILGGKDLAFMCRCASTKFSQEMSVEQIQEIQKGTPEGQYQNIRMLSFVYQPCLEAPIYAMITKSCISNPQNKYLMKHPEATCACLGANVAGGIKEAAPIYIEAVAGGQYQDVGPLDLLVNIKEFESKYEHFSKRCVKKFEKR